MKKGFTLIELVAVIFVLGIIGTIAVVAVDKIIKDNKENLYKIQVNNIEAATRTWGDAHISLLPDNKDEAISIPLIILKQDGLLDKNYKNPKNGELFYDNMYIDISYENGNYVYNLIEDSGTESFLDGDGNVDLYYPSIILKEKFNYSSALNSYDVYISSINKNISSKTLSSVNDNANKTATMTHTENGKVFTIVRKEKTN